MSKEHKSSHRMGNWERHFELLNNRGEYQKGTKITIGWIDDGDASRPFFKVDNKLVDGYQVEPLLHIFAMNMIAFSDKMQGFIKEINR